MNCAYGVVRDGQVVLEVPLPLADGTRVAVNPMSDSSVSSEQSFKTEEERREAAEKLILQMAGLWAARPETADPDEWVRRQWGRHE